MLPKGILLDRLCDPPERHRNQNRDRNFLFNFSGRCKFSIKNALSHPFSDPGERNPRRELKFRLIIIKLSKNNNPWFITIYASKKKGGRKCWSERTNVNDVPARTTRRLANCRTGEWTRTRTRTCTTATARGATNSKGVNYRRVLRHRLRWNTQSTHLCRSLYP